MNPPIFHANVIHMQPLQEEWSRFRTIVDNFLVSTVLCGIPALRALFLFLSFPIRDPALNPSYEFSNHVHHQARQHKYAFKPATTCTTTSSLISFRLTISTISSSLSYEIVDDFDPYPGYFYVSLFSDLESTEIPSRFLCAEP